MTEVENDVHLPDPTKVLRDTGLLYIINTKILHQFGFHLVLLQNLDAEGRPVSSNDPVGEFALLATDDLEGYQEDPEVAAQGRERYHNFLRHMGAARLSARRAAQEPAEQTLETAGAESEPL